MDSKAPITVFDTNASVDVQIGSKTYKATFLRVRDLIDLQKWLFLLPVRRELEYQELMPAELYTPEAKRVRLEMAESSARVPGSGFLLGEPGSIRNLKNFEGMARYLWLAIHSLDKAITFDDVADASLDQLTVAYRAIEELCGGLLGNPQEVPSEEGTKPQSSGG